MKIEQYNCDDCGKTIDGKCPFPIQIVGGGQGEMAGGGQLCTLQYQGIMGHNGFSNDKHYHYQCFSEVVRRINTKKV